MTDDKLRKEKQELQEKLASMSQVIEELSKGYKEPGGSTKEIEEKVGFEIKGVKDALENMDKKIEKSVKKQDLASQMKREIEDALDPIKDQIAALQKLTSMEERLKMAEEKLAGKQIPQEILSLQKALEGFTPQDVKRMQTFADSADVLIRAEVRSEVKRRFLEVFKDLKDVQAEMNRLSEELEKNIDEIGGFDKRLVEVTAVKKNLEKLADQLKRMELGMEKRIFDVYKKQGEKVMENMLKDMFPNYIEPRFKEEKEDIEKWVTDVFYKTNKSIDFIEGTINMARKDLEARIKELAEMKKVVAMVSSSLAEAKSYSDFNDEKLDEKHESIIEDKISIVKKDLERALVSAMAEVEAAELRVNESGKIMQKRLDMADRESSKLKALVVSAREESEEISSDMEKKEKLLKAIDGRLDGLEESIEEEHKRTDKVSADIQSLKGAILDLRRLVKEVAE